MKKIEDNSCSLLLHFWSTSRSPFSTYYIPFQSSGSQESNALNCIRFGAKMRKIWPSEDNCTMHVRISHSSPSKCEFRTAAQASANFAQQPMHVRNSHQPMHLWFEFSSVLPTPHEIFSYVFFMQIPFLSL